MNLTEYVEELTRHHGYQWCAGRGVNGYFARAWKDIPGSIRRECINIGGDNLLMAMCNLLAKLPRIPGKGGIDAIVGKWPGDETDEELQQILKEMG